MIANIIDLNSSGEGNLVFVGMVVCFGNDNAASSIVVAGVVHDAVVGNDISLLAILVCTSFTNDLMCCMSQTLVGCFMTGVIFYVFYVYCYMT